MTNVNLIVNGTEHDVEIPATESLAETLRERLRYGSVREACGVGMCGSCTVLLDGVAVSSCLVFTSLVDAQAVVTAEGLDEIDGGYVQEAFVTEEAFQCGYCIPGMTVAAYSLIESSSTAPSADEIREHLSGNLCRCGCYPRIVKAVQRAGSMSENAKGSSSCV